MNNNFSPQSVILSDEIKGVISSIDHCLTAKENQNLFIEWKENNCTQNRDTIILGNLRLIVSVIKSRSFSDPSYSMDDMFQIGVCALIKAVDTFDYTKQLTFSTYANCIITNEINMIWRKVKHLDKQVSLEEPITINDKGNNIYFMDIISDDFDMTEDLEHKVSLSLLKKGLPLLSERDRNIIVDRFGLYDHKPLTQMELAKKYHFSQAYICRIVRKSLTKLNAYICENS